MKKAFLLLLCGAFAFCACQKDPVPSKDSTLDGTAVEVSSLSTSARKLFVLNEGGLGSNNASLDFLRFQDGKYVTGSFKKMNPEIGAGLGDVGNDIAIHGDEAWIVVNNSGIVEVISAEDETEIAAIKVPTPRNIAFDGNYAYVTSWAGAFATYEGYNIVDSKNCKGQVYRINLGSKKVEGTAEVGYQPEGIAVYNGKLYVANSGGISSQLGPDYAYDNTVSIIDAASFKVEKTVTVQVNLKNVYSDGKGRIYVTTLGNYNDVHSGLYTFTTAHPESVEKVADYVSVSAICGDKVYCIGTESELDWYATHVYASWAAVDGAKSAWNLTITEAPYGLAALDASTFFVSDAGDYFNPGTVACYHNGSKLWTVTAGVCPGHFALY
jgi:hypothetical protein